MDIYVPAEVKGKVLVTLLSRLKALQKLKVDDFIGEYRFVLGDHTYVMHSDGEKLWIKKNFDYMEIEMTESDEIFELLVQIYRLVVGFEENRNKGEEIMEFLAGLL